MITVDKRFKGPPTSANGGYVCGLLSQFVDGPAVSVRLRLPVTARAAISLICNREAEVIDIGQGWRYGFNL